MTHSSYEFPVQPVHMEHLECGAEWDMYTSEWPPKVVICTQCQIPLKLVGHDRNSKRLAYRRI